ncbi:PBECR4 domain-containing protein [Clostridium sp. SGI.024]|uniref:PBECR4 domain-containing protein n=1 Tax=Clostridium sp. SGI.024 TaxID=3420551 RepID=UPI003D08F050
MLTVTDLLGVNNISNISDISLKLYKEFFDNILCKRLFLYNLEDGKEIKLVFDPNNLLHILGAQHILGEKYKAQKFNIEIINGDMTFQDLEKRNSIVFNDYTSRFLNFSNLYHVITNCTMVYFDKETYNKNRKSKKESLMDFSYILYEDLNNKKIHAGLDTYNKGFSFYCKSLLVKSSSNDIIIKDQKPVKINNIKVIDIDTKVVLLNKDIEDEIKFVLLNKDIETEDKNELPNKNIDNISNSYVQVGESKKI